MSIHRRRIAKSMPRRRSMPGRLMVDQSTAVRRCGHSVRPVSAGVSAAGLDGRWVLSDGASRFWLDQSGAPAFNFDAFSSREPAYTSIENAVVRTLNNV